MKTFSSVLIWFAIALCMIIWLPVMATIRLIDRDPSRYYTGKVFRRLGWLLTKLNPGWKIKILGNTTVNDRQPYIVIANHLSNADIPVISNLPWEMKWVSKKELFSVPVTGWMMRLAGDIPVDRKSENRGAAVYKLVSYYLENRCSVIFFPEGTRSKSGKMNRFAKGAFEMAIRRKVNILPIVVDGTQNCLPKHSWKFGPAEKITIKILEPISVENVKREELDQFIEKVRAIMLAELAEIRGASIREVDGLATL